MTNLTGLRLAIDIGGTFTDTVLVDAAEQVLATDKSPTTRQDPAMAALTGAGHVLAAAGKGYADVSGFIHGTTLATNALIERNGANVAAITTAGFRDILEIGYERRYDQYDIDLVKPDLIVPRARCFTIGGRMNVGGQELEPLDEQGVKGLIAALHACEADAVAICLLHAYANPAHELQLRELLKTELPGLAISLSHEISPEAREFDRLCTTIANAYIQPLMKKYLTRFQVAFTSEGLPCPILMMTAGGGMTTMKTAARLPIRLVESGPAGGAILAARIAAEVGEKNVLSFDMGGTTAKLCLIDSYQPQSARKFEISRASRFVKGSGMPVRIPVLEMIEIGAGGGSIAAVDRLGRLSVGPQSAGSDPGPAAFGKGGHLPTVTDADVVQGLIDPARFAEGRLQIDVSAAKAVVAETIGSPLGLTDVSAARGVSEIVDESMASAGRMHAVEAGKDLGDRVMIAFGGNGPLHATRVARRAGISRILVPRDPGVGSAVGFLHAPVSFEIVRSRYSTLDTLDLDGLNHFFDEILAEARTVVRAGAPAEAITQARTAFLRYQGQGHEIEITLPDRPLLEADRMQLRTDFETEYSRQFSRAVPGMTIEALNWSVRVSSSTPEPNPTLPPVDRTNLKPEGTRRIFCNVTNAWREVGIFDRETLNPGDHIAGPALIMEPQTTTFVAADFSAKVDQGGNIWMTCNREATR